MTRIVLLISLFALSAQSIAATLTNRPGGPPWPSGVGEIYTTSRYNDWKNWSGREADVAVVWGAAGPATWADITTGGASKWTDALNTFPKTTYLVHRYPLLPATHSNRKFANPSVWTQAADGDFDAYYHQAFSNMRERAIKAGRPADDLRVIFSPGWEFNGDWYHWSISVSTLSDFKIAYARIVNIWRQYFPGGLVDFAPASNFGGENRVLTLEQMLPDSSTYDFISKSMHDSTPHVTDETTWNNSQYNPPASAKRFGLSHILQAAQARGKKLAFSEWATNMADCSSTHTTSPNPAFYLKKVHDFFAANASMIAYEGYFSPNCTSLDSRPGTQAAQTYKSLWVDDGTGGNQDPVAPKPPEFVVAE